MREYLIIFFVLGAIVVNPTHSASPTSKPNTSSDGLRNKDDGKNAIGGNIPPCDHKCQMMKTNNVAKTPESSKVVESSVKPKRASKKKSAKAAKAKLNAIESTNATLKRAQPIAEKSGATNKKAPKSTKSKKKGNKSSLNKSSSGDKGDLKAAPEAAPSQKKITQAPNSTTSGDVKLGQESPTKKSVKKKKKKVVAIKPSAKQNVSSADESLATRKQESKTGLENASGSAIKSVAKDATQGAHPPANVETPGKTPKQINSLGTEGAKPAKKAKKMSAKKKAKKIASKKASARSNSKMSSTNDSLEAHSNDESSDASENSTEPAQTSTVSITTEVQATKPKAPIKKLWVTDYPPTSSRRTTEYDTRYFDAYLIVQDRRAAKAAAAAALKGKA